MPANTKFSLPLANRKSVSVVVAETADGRIIARTPEELETLPLEEQTAVALVLGRDLPAPGRSS